MSDRTNKRVPQAPANGHAASDMPPSHGGGFALQLPTEALRPLIAEVVAQTMARLESDRAHLPDRIAFGEAEAARLLGLHENQLRDERRKKRITASVGPGRKILYTRDDLTRYLSERRWPLEQCRQERRIQG